MGRWSFAQMQLRTSQESEINHECDDFDGFHHQSNEIYLINYAQPLLCIWNKFGTIGIYHTRCSSGYTYKKCAAAVPMTIHTFFRKREGLCRKCGWII